MLPMVQSINGSRPQSRPNTHTGVGGCGWCGVASSPPNGQRHPTARLRLHFDPPPRASDTPKAAPRTPTLGWGPSTNASIWMPAMLSTCWDRLLLNRVIVHAWMANTNWEARPTSVITSIPSQTQTLQTGPPSRNRWHHQHYPPQHEWPPWRCCWPWRRSDTRQRPLSEYQRPQQR